MERINTKKAQAEHMRKKSAGVSAERMRKELHDVGFLVTASRLRDSESEHQYAIKINKAGRDCIADLASASELMLPIFQNNPTTKNDKERRGDGRRKQVAVSKVLEGRRPSSSGSSAHTDAAQKVADEGAIEALTKVRRSMKAFVVSLFPGHLLVGGVLILSQAGCAPQHCHMDGLYTSMYTKGHQLVHPLVALSAIYAFDDETYLWLWPRGHKLFERCSPTATLAELQAAGLEPIQCEQVHIPKGHLIVFRQDLPHGGAAYPAHNIRMHAYFEPPGFDHAVDSVGHFSEDFISMLLLPPPPAPTV